MARGEKSEKHDCLVQTTVSEELEEHVKTKARLEGISVAAYIRRLIIRDREQS